MLLVVVVKLRIALHFIEVLLIVDRSANNLAGIRDRTQELQTRERDRRRARCDLPRSCGNLVQILDKEIVSWKRISLARYDFKGCCDIANIRTLHKPQTVISKSAKTHINFLSIMNAGFGSPTVAAVYEGVNELESSRR